MTNEEIIQGLYRGDSKAIDMAIKVLEQEPVLDKIRAEIEQRKKNSGGEPNRNLAFNVCLQIIDKYTAESEE